MDCVLTSDVWKRNVNRDLPSSFPAILVTDNVIQRASLAGPREYDIKKIHGFRLSMEHVWVQG